MIYRTRNYIELEQLTPEQRKPIEYATHLPHTLIQRSSLLLYDFVDRYLIDEEAQKNLISHVELYPETVKAIIGSILDSIDEAAKMLEECQGIEESIVG